MQEHSLAVHVSNRYVLPVTEPLVKSTYQVIIDIFLLKILKREKRRECTSGCLSCLTKGIQPNVGLNL